MKLSRKLREMREVESLLIPPPRPSEFFLSLGAHGIVSVPNLGQGWIIQCVCGFESKACQSVAEAGAEFDKHLEGEMLIA